MDLLQIPEPVPVRRGTAGQDRPLIYPSLNLSKGSKDTCMLLLTPDSFHFMDFLLIPL